MHPLERLAAEQRAREEEEEKQRLEQEKLAKIREERDRERRQADEEARARLRREEEAAERAIKRREEEKAKERRSYVPPGRATETEGANTWRRTGPSTPNRTPVSLPPARSESPAPVPKFRPGAAAGGGWRARQAAKEAEAAAGNTPSRPQTPVAKPPPARDEPDEEGFKPVWRPSRGRGGGYRA